MTTLEALRGVLLADSGVTAQISTRLYPLTMPDASPMPSVVYSVVTMVPASHFTGYSIAYNRVQIDVYGKTYQSARDAWAAIEAVLRPLSQPELSAQLESERDIYEDDTQLFRVSCDVSVWRAQ